MSGFSNLAHQNSASSDHGRSQYVSLVRATDIDEFLNAVRGYQFGLLQLDRGSFAGGADSDPTRRSTFDRSAFCASRSSIRGAASREITFAVRMSPTPALWQGRQFGLHELIMGEPGAEVDLVSQPDYSAATASFPPNLVEETAERFGWTLPSRASTSDLVGIRNEQGRALRAGFHKLFNEAIRRPFDRRAAAWALSKQEDLLRALLQCTFNDLIVPKPSTAGSGLGC